MGDMKTAPICMTCWIRREPGIPPTTLVNSRLRTCSLCGERTQAGIFIREHIDRLPHHVETIS
jgi:hypothetical protein